MLCKSSQEATTTTTPALLIVESTTSSTSTLYAVVSSKAVSVSSSERPKGSEVGVAEGGGVEKKKPISVARGHFSR